MRVALRRPRDDGHRGDRDGGDGRPTVPGHRYQSCLLPAFGYFRAVSASRKSASSTASYIAAAPCLPFTAGTGRPSFLARFFSVPNAPDGFCQVCGIRPACFGLLDGHPVPHRRRQLRHAGDDHRGTVTALACGNNIGRARVASRRQASKTVRCRSSAGIRPVPSSANWRVCLCVKNATWTRSPRRGPSRIPASGPRA